jgi:hypothetical protein
MGLIDARRGKPVSRLLRRVGSEAVVISKR